MRAKLFLGRVDMSEAEDQSDLRTGKLFNRVVTPIPYVRAAKCRCAEAKFSRTLPKDCGSPSQIWCRVSTKGVDVVGANDCASAFKR